MNRDRRPIIHDSSSYPLAGSRDRRRGGACDDGPTDARSALQDHMQKSMGDEAYTKACILLGYFERALLGPDAGEGEGEPAAMDSRVLDHGPSKLVRMFPDAPNPRLAPNAGALDPSATSKRLLDHRPGELAEMFPNAKAPMRV